MMRVEQARLFSISAHAYGAAAAAAACAAR